jgi:uncharacterized protein YaiI (UPF0178 family)
LPPQNTITILVDADACPVKEEIFKVAFRLKIGVILVTNSYFRIPNHPLIAIQVVNKEFDAADDWIIQNCSTMSVVITSDILLAHRCIENHVGSVMGPNGNTFTEQNIGNSIAIRAIMADLRAGIENTKGQTPFSKKDREKFLNTLDLELTKLKRLAIKVDNPGK